MTATSITNGWDAVCAMNVRAINAILFQQYLKERPTTGAEQVRALVDGGDGGSWLLDLTLGPPEVRFPNDIALDANQCQVKMFIVRGTLLRLDNFGFAVDKAIIIPPNSSWLTGVLDLMAVQGEVNQLGAVVLDLGSGAYTPAIRGVDPASTLATEIGAVIKTFFKYQATTYRLGVIVATETSAGLTPTRFDIATQVHPQSNDDGCVLLLIQTNGPGGSEGALASYPIPDGNTAALIVSDRTLFNSVFPDALNKSFASIGTLFSGRQSPDGWYVQGDGGTFECGQISVVEGKLNSVYSSDSTQHAKPVNIPFTGFEIRFANGSVSANWNHSWKQYFTIESLASKYASPQLVSASMEASYQRWASPHVDSTTDDVTFVTNSESTECRNADSPGWWSELMGAFDVPDMVKSTITGVISPSMKNFSVPDVNTFALANLLFPSQHKLSLTGASVPCDLVLAGQMSVPLAVGPASVKLTPGQTQRFTATKDGQPLTGVTWELMPRGPRYGSIAADGTYSAPATVSAPEIVVVSAISNSDATCVGRAMVMLYHPAPPGSLVIAPEAMAVTPGQPIAFTVYDEQGNVVQANCTINPQQGALERSSTGEEWQYQAPFSLDPPEPLTVTITAVSQANPSQQGTAIVQVTPNVTVTVSVVQTSGAAGGTIHLSAVAPGADTLHWAASVGAVTVDSSDGTTASYTAPASVKAGTNVTIIAYSLGDALGAGFTQIMVPAPPG